MKGPAIFLAQFVDEQSPFDSIESLCRWVAQWGYKAVQIPVWDKRLIDIKKIAQSKTYADEYKAKVEACGVVIADLSTHLIGQLIAVHPAYDLMFDGFAPEHVRGNPKARTEWAVQELQHAAKAAKHLGIKACASFSGALLWHTVYPWPQRPQGLREDGFAELAKRWIPILNYFDQEGIDIGYELHPGEDLHDGVSYELFLEHTHHHPRACLLYDPSHFLLQCMDYLAFIDIYHQRIKMFHVKDAEFLPNGKQGVYGGYQDWKQRAGRFRSLGDGQVDFKKIFSKLTQYGYKGWAVLEWECCLKDKTQGAKEGAPFIAEHLIELSEKSFDDFSKVETNNALNRKILGLLP